MPLPLAPRKIGVRLSLVDRSLTVGPTVGRGVCLRFRALVRGIDPLGLLRHPGLTLTVAEPDRLAATVRLHTGTPDERHSATARRGHRTGI